MEDALFSNKTTLNAELVKEATVGNNRTIFSIYQTLGILSAGMLVFMIPQSLGAGVKLEQTLMILAAPVCLTAVFLYLGFFLPKQQARRWEKRKEAVLPGKAAVNRYYFFPDYMFFKAATADKEVKIEYKEIKKVKETAKLMLMTTEKKQLFIIEKKGFDKKDKALPFIRSIKEK